MAELRVTSDARPSNVVRFEQLMYLALGFGFVDTLWRWSEIVKLADRVGAEHTVVVVTLVYFAFKVLLIWLAARKHQSWARWILLIIFVVSLKPYHGFQRSSHVYFELILQLGQLVGYSTALFLIFTGNSREWFRSSAYIPANPA